MTSLPELFDRLRREPDIDAPELQAFDATDELLLTTAQQLIGSGLQVPEGTLVTIGDSHGALTLGAATVLGARGIRAQQDALLGELALAANAGRLGLADTFTSHPLDESLVTGARLVLVQLPRGLAALDELADLVARFAHPEVVVLAGGRVKHMTRAMNEVLGRSFHEVTAGLAHRKSRVLTARAAKQDTAFAAPRFPVWGDDQDLAFQIAAFGATFGGATLDHGSRLLLQTLDEQPPAAPQHVLDLGCGNGVLATAAALRWPNAEVIATDQSAAAVAATTLTATRAGVADRVRVQRADATEQVPDAWADLVLLNPPFHLGSTVHAGVAHRLIASCARVLAPGGELRLVFNSHLRYRSVATRLVGPASQLARNRHFTVLSVGRRTHGVS